MVMDLRFNWLRDGFVGQALRNSYGYWSGNNRSGNKCVQPSNKATESSGSCEQHDSEFDRLESKKSLIEEQENTNLVQTETTLELHATQVSPSIVLQGENMSIFSKIEGVAKTIAHEVEEALIKISLAEPNIERVTATTISAVAPIVVSIAAVSGNEPEAAAITGIVVLVQNELAALQVTLNQAGAGTVNISVKATLAAINANLGALLTGGMIKNPQTLATVTADVQKISAAINVLVSAL